MAIWTGSAGAGAASLLQLPGAAVIEANPSNYQAMLRRLKPGDTLNLAPGTYRRLYLSRLNGTPDSWITITGPRRGGAGHHRGRTGSKYDRDL